MIFKLPQLFTALRRHKRNVEKKLEIIEITLEKLHLDKNAWIIDEWLKNDPYGLRAAYPKNCAATLFLVIVKFTSGEKITAGFVGSFSREGDNNSKELSIYIDRSLRIKGIGQKAVQLFIDLTRPEILMAVTELNNIPCRKLLERSKFHRAKPNDKPNFASYCYMNIYQSDSP